MILIKICCDCTANVDDKEVEKNVALTDVKVQRVETKIFPGGFFWINQDIDFNLNLITDCETEQVFCYFFLMIVNSDRDQLKKNYGNEFQNLNLTEKDEFPKDDIYKVPRYKVSPI